jgi:integrase
MSDDAAVLTADERSALVFYGDPPKVKRLGVVKRTQLQRVLQPIDTAWERVSHSQGPRLIVTRALVHTMARTGLAFWGWDRETWVETIHMPQCWPHRAVAYALAYHLGALTVSDAAEDGVHPTYFARRMFGDGAVEAEIRRMTDLACGVGYKRRFSHSVPGAVARLLLLAGECKLEALTIEVIESAHAAERHRTVRQAFSRVATVLHSHGMLERPIRRPTPGGDALVGVPPEWADWCQRWRATSVVGKVTAGNAWYSILRAGRWLAAHHPDVTAPEHWTRQMATAYVACVDRSRVGDYASSFRNVGPKGEPLDAKSKDRLLAGMRRFFGDCHEWGWCPVRFNPQRAFATPRAVKALINRDPKVIADDIWAKLMWAGMNLAAEDVPKPSGGPISARREGSYPLAMLRALAITWLFAGLRSNELVRLRVGCVRWQERDGAPAAATTPSATAACLLDVPVNKTNAGYTKPVDPIVGAAINIWERDRLVQPILPDDKTGERVALLFSYRGRRLPPTYINRSLIPMLCRKAGVPEFDARGRITSHRARHTIATQLFNAKDPMNLFELQEWLGHSSPKSTEHYVKITQTRLAKAYSDAGYFARNIRAIDVLVDRAAAEDGTAASGKPWQYFDLGHGYCTYTFFEQCRHRMACARCDFYLPKGSTKAQLLEAKANLQRMLVEIPLLDEERAAVEDGQTALDRLLERLADVSTPAGQTPRQLASSRNAKLLPVIQLPVERGEVVE